MIVTLRTAPVPPLRTPSVTFVPSAPVIRPADAVADSPATATPSTDTIQSPAAMPAALAGEPAKTWVTTSFLPRLSNLAPIPK